MQKKFAMTFNGQQIQKADIDLMGNSASHGDDAALYATYAGSGTKGIVPQSSAPIGLNTGLNVAVEAFTAMSFPSEDPTAARVGWYEGGIIPIGANSSGLQRWDAIYAILSTDVNGPSDDRKIKSPTTAVVSSTSVVTYTECTCTVAVAAGTPDASPQFPAIPSDSGGVYYILLGYVLVLNGSSGFIKKDINNAATILHAGPTVLIASSNSDVSTALQTDWANFERRPTHFIHKSASFGATSLLVALDLRGTTPSAWSHQQNGVVDSRDWRNRICRWTIATGIGTSTCGFPWYLADAHGASPNEVAASDDALSYTGTSLSPIATGMGQSWVYDGSIADKAFVCHHLPYDGIGTLRANLQLYVDLADNGKLKVQWSGGSASPVTPGAVFVIWMDWSGAFTHV